MVVVIVIVGYCGSGDDCHEGHNYGRDCDNGGCGFYDGRGHGGSDGVGDCCNGDCNDGCSTRDIYI